MGHLANTRVLMYPNGSYKPPITYYITRVLMYPNGSYKPPITYYITRGLYTWVLYSIIQL